MVTRRALLKAAAATGMLALLPAWADDQDFNTLYSMLLAHPELLAGGNDREGRMAESATRAITPHIKPSATPVSDNAAKLIILFEVTSQAVYEKKYRHPVVPAAESGVTIGVGYDLGYVQPEWLTQDWGDYLDGATVKRLAVACGLTRTKAKAVLPKVKDIDVPWATAEKQFKEILLPRYVAETENALLNTKELSPDSLGALVSLVYNRGPSFKKTGDRYTEMHQIGAHMENEAFTGIPQELLDMRRLWQNNPDTKGLVTRRELEAALFKQGLA
ncbi:GH24 family phage-related lysozyme (muramidase) [Silvimonas terrae]|uniref:GH24 family phage-related lysozyme (Muramidase) n=1 Tax=Silvimonas terrae TaxID=300266 RepID=A0A840RCT4_9NEIS|nr:hypothetical protein [Silvimonas terrae]MBB5190236.1 GH24 family phage-related lysozyme (muramidase) [Silvimonas terrae]